MSDKLHTHRYIYDKTTQTPSHIKIPIWGHHNPGSRIFHMDVDTMRDIFEESIKQLENEKWTVKSLHPASHLGIRKVHI